MSDEPNGHDLDPQETREWLESLEAVLEHDGPERARFLLAELVEHGHARGSHLPFDANTPYVNTIAPGDEPPYPGDLDVERRIRALLRWNAMAMVVRANKTLDGIGGHIATYQSIAELFEVGFQHFWRAPEGERGGDLVFFQGHASPGIYARAFLEGRLEVSHLERFRQEVGSGGLPSYPHPWLMPDFWQFATVSMGLTSVFAIYQARFLKYLGNRGLVDAEGRKVWATLGDGEMDEPESLGAITLASRERLDNLVFLVNCNLQRLDGPVRGNGKIVQELESVFRGAGWNVLKVLWGSEWDDLFERDRDGLLRRRLREVVDGDFQAYTVKGGAYMREHLFGTSPELLKLVEHLSDDQLARLRRGGHDPRKIHAAYRAAVEHRGQPTVILAHSVKGLGMGAAGEGLNIAHQAKKMPTEAVRAFRDVFEVPIEDAELDDLPFLRPPDDSPEIRYLKKRRAALGGPFPQRRTAAEALEIPALEDLFEPLLGGSGERQISTTMAFVRALTLLLREKGLKERLVPIVADEARTFGMEGMFRQIGIYAPRGQLYEPVDKGQLAYYREEQSGQILQEGINEAGALASWTAAGMSYSTHGLHMIPFFIFYSMFGFQRVGDFIWAAADMQARGFLIGATSGRTTLNGEGLQHEDGHSHLVASTVPNCVSYDPTFGYELAVILHEGLERMYGERDESVFYYVTTLNENYEHPPMPEGAEEGILRGMYLLRPSPLADGGDGEGDGDAPRVQLLGSGAILNEVRAAAEILEEDHGVAADVWSVTSFNELARDGRRARRHNLLHPEAEPETSWIERCLADHPGPVVASTDYVRALPDQVRAYLPRRYAVLGTDGFGRSDSREKLRAFFEVDRRYVVLAALTALVEEGALERSALAAAIDRHGIDPDQPDPLLA